MDTYLPCEIVLVKSYQPRCAICCHVGSDVQVHPAANPHTTSENLAVYDLEDDSEGDKSSQSFRVEHGVFGYSFLYMHVESISRTRFNEKRTDCRVVNEMRMIWLRE